MMRAWHLLAGLVGAVVLSGCITHEARVTVPPTPAPAANTDPDGPTTMILGTKVSPAAAQPTVFHGPLPQDITVSAWRRDDDGTIRRGEAHVVTPLPWWQRFPCDAFVDLAPFDASIRTDATITLEPVQAVDEDALLHAARCDGYASGDPAKQP